MSDSPLTAFVVVVDPDGSPSLIMDIPEETLPLQRQPTYRDVRRALLELSADLAAQAAAQYVLSTLASAKEEPPSTKVAKAVAKRRKETA